MRNNDLMNGHFLFSDELINKTIQYFKATNRPINREDAAEFLSSLVDLAALVYKISPSSKVAIPPQGGIAPDLISPHSCKTDI